MAEKELNKVIQKHKDEARILRGSALDINAYPYVERYQRVAEMEAQLKVNRLERDLPKFVSAEKRFLKQFSSDDQEIRKQTLDRLGLNDSYLIDKDEGTYER
mmetsp:Transcript_14211/g.24168  ORF Transcript_14211/g.24168 Transcript_14211/m.24168 type:complete len:102 (-) Transcript_14211:260-565(-)